MAEHDSRLIYTARANIPWWQILLLAIPPLMLIGFAVFTIVVVGHVLITLFFLVFSGIATFGFMWRQVGRYQVWSDRFKAVGVIPLPRDYSTLSFDDFKEVREYGWQGHFVGSNPHSASTCSKNPLVVLTTPDEMEYAVTPVDEDRERFVAELEQAVEAYRNQHNSA